jgi:hypothetical protein
MLVTSEHAIERCVRAARTALVLLLVSVTVACAPPGTPAGARPHFGGLHDGVYWTTCVDTASGFLELTNWTWGERVRASNGLRCSDAPVETYSERSASYSTLDRAAVTFWLGEDRIELLAWRGPWRPDHDDGACPVRPSRAAFAATARTIEEAAEITRFSPTQRDALRIAAQKLRQIEPDRLWTSGNWGTNADTEFYCAEIDHVLSETSPEFPEELKGRRE